MNAISLNPIGLARRVRLRKAAFLPVLPPLVVLAIFFAIPMGMMLGLSLKSQDTGGLNLVNYSLFIKDELILAGAFRTVAVSVLVAACVTVMAYPVAYFLARSNSRGRAVVFAIAIAPELAGVVLRTYGWMIILEEHGLVNNLLLSTGLIESPLIMTKNMFGVVIGLIHVLLPFGILSIKTSIDGIDPNQERAAQVLGASRWKVIRHVVLPLATPGLVASFLIAVTLAASAYATPALLGGDGFSVLATMIYKQVLFYLNWPLAAALANILLIGVIAIAVFGGRIESRLGRKVGA